MRSTIWKTLVLGLSLIGLTAGVRVAQAQAPVTLIQYTNSWKYFTNGTDLGTAWTATNFNDTAWPAGRGLLGFETDTSQYTRAPFNTVFTPFRAATITYYFRTHFNLQVANLCGITLIASNYFDDGGAIYLNGTEMAVVRVTSGSAFNIVATAGPGTEGQNDVVTYIPPEGVLKQGDNVVAVEVKQNGTGSSDIVFGMQLMAFFTPLTPITITNQPQNATTPLGAPTMFCASASGSIPGYRWQRDNGTGVYTNIPNATANCYTINSTQLTNAGNYRVVITNCSSARTSSVATLTVVADTEGPLLVSAIANETLPPTIILKFNERVRSPEVVALSNYTITSVPPGTSLIISNLSYNPAGSLLQIRTSPWNTATNYVVTVNNVRDDSANTNLITPNSKIGLATWREILPYESFWNWRQIRGDDGVPVQPAVDWMSASFNEYVHQYGIDQDGDWNIFFNEPGFHVGQAMFSVGTFSVPNQILQYSSNSYYFKTRIDLGTNLAAIGAIKFTHMIDDGAVFYLNGKEVYRFNMPAAPTAVDYYTVASSSIPKPVEVVSAEVSITNFARGTNIIAVELHQQADDFDDSQTDAGFDVRVRAALAPNISTPPRPRITFVRNASVLTLTWSDPSFRVQSSTNVIGPWANVVGNPLSPYSASIGGTNGPRRFFRLFQ